MKFPNLYEQFQFQCKDRKEIEPGITSLPVSGKYAGEVRLVPVKISGDPPHSSRDAFGADAARVGLYMYYGRSSNESVKAIFPQWVVYGCSPECSPAARYH
jgi:hypothetical protein